ncbi:hypothetical protein MDA_GLEAN10012898 [Myotis davidii]|uniref:Uncharacterized protein n=1 Tax=Myotis davidii TaxID=225400 RepID=L5M4F9_MYODS|nr:hypothetical protein MDA_GLEAN10012898 [Myotis davidii]
MASNVPLVPSQRQHRDLSCSGLGYHVSGTSKSLAELSEMPPGGKGQNKMSKERRGQALENRATITGQGSCTATWEKSRQVLSMESSVQPMAGPQTHPR